VFVNECGRKGDAFGTLITLDAMRTLRRSAASKRWGKAAAAREIPGRAGEHRSRPLRTHACAPGSVSNRSSRSPASAFVAHRSSQPATSESTHAASRSRAATNAALAAPASKPNWILMSLRAFICPSCRFGGGTAQRRELHSCLADQFCFEPTNRLLRRGHARPVGQPIKRPDEGCSVSDVRATRAHHDPQECGRFTRAKSRPV